MIDFNVRNYLKALVPPGNYSVRIKKLDLKATKETINGRDNSKFLQLTFEIISPFMKGQALFDNMNIYHSKENVSIMGRERLASLCEAVDLLDIRNIHDLLDKILDIEVANDFDSRGNQVAKIVKFIKPLGEISAQHTKPIADDGYGELIR